jgi:hypothetical protein
MAGAYENPQRLTGDTQAGAFAKGLMQNQQNLTAQNEARAREEARRKEKAKADQQRIIENMQRVQGTADVWNLEQMSNLATAPKTSAIQDELTRTLNSRIDIATQAQIYLKTQFGDNEKRVSAQKAITDYYDLLSLSKTATQNFVATGDYWRENAAEIGKKVTIIGSTPDEIANNQFFVNALGGVYSDADFEMAYDEEKNDIMIKVSGNEPERLENGQLVEGQYREKYISARAWNAQSAENKQFSFVSSVPQIVTESLERMKPADKTPNNDGLGIIKANGQFADKYWSKEQIFRDRIKVQGSRSRRTEEVRQYLNVDEIRKDMMSILKSKVSGVNGNVQMAANAWNIDLKQLNEGIENEYQTLQPTDEQFEQVLFDQIIQARTQGLKQDENGFYMSGGKSVVQSKSSGSNTNTPISTYRNDYYSNIVRGGTGGLNNTQVTLSNLTKITGPKSQYMTKENIYETWLNTPFGDFSGSPSNAEHYEKRDEDPKAVFNKLAPKEGLYKIIGNKPVYAGNYNLNSATDRLKFALDNTTASERTNVQKTTLMKTARQIDWQADNPKKADETLTQYAERMNKAIK